MSAHLTFLRMYCVLELLDSAVCEYIAVFFELIDIYRRQHILSWFVDWHVDLLTGCLVVSLVV